MQSASHCRRGELLLQMPVGGGVASAVHGERQCTPAHSGRRTRTLGPLPGLIQGHHMDPGEHMARLLPLLLCLIALPAAALSPESEAKNQPVAPFRIAG